MSNENNSPKVLKEAECDDAVAGLGRWDVSKVRSMSSMFQGAAEDDERQAKRTRS